MLLPAARAWRRPGGRRRAAADLAAAACLAATVLTAASPDGGGRAAAQGSPAAPARPVPLPPERPADPAAPAQPVPLPPERPPGLGADAAPAPPAADAGLPAAEAACREALSAAGVTFEPAPAIRDGACGAPHPVRVARLPGDVKIGQPAAMTCGLAQALATWARESVGPAARRELGVELSAIEVGTVYECRGQNRDASARLSEHAFANGVDIAGFTFADGTSLTVAAGQPGRPGRDPQAQARFLSAVRSGACTVFTTVLGPGSEGHADHLHLDMRARPGGYRICQ